jgi:glucosyl-dolichyl phosphate glucuronosyltransferase
LLVSIIIPTLNRARLLKRTLFSLFQQLGEVDFEVIVVDNGSGDDTKQVVESYQASEPRLTYIFDDRPGLLVGRNVGAHRAKGSILSFIDDDVIVPPCWIEGIGEVFRDEQVHLATGNNYPFFEATAPEWIGKMWQSYGSSGRYLYQLSLLELGDSGLEIEPYLVWGLNYHIRKKVYLDVGGFNPDILSKDYQYFIGDGETGIADKIAAHNYNAYFHPKLSLYHTVTSERLTKEYFVRRSYTEGMMHAYTDLRNTGVAEEKKERWAILGSPLVLARKAMRTVKHLDTRFGKQDPELRELRHRIQAALARGYRDYAEHFKDNSLLSQYVHEENYLDIDRIAGTYYFKG